MPSQGNTQKPPLKQISTICCGVVDEITAEGKANCDGHFGEALYLGNAPVRSLLFSDATCRWRVEKFRLLDNNPANWSIIQTNLKRVTPLLQDPTETFAKMNDVMHQSLKYVKDVESIDFSCHHVIDFNGQLMEDPLRVFLSVCTSVLANFSFCSQLDVRKLLSFLSDLFEGYSTDNAYHNALHAADSVQMLFLILREKPATLIFTDDEVIIAFLATLCLGYVHPGVTNAFLSRIDHPLVLVYGDMSTQQSASLTAFLYLLNREENRFIDLSASGGVKLHSQFLRELLVETVLGTAPRARFSLLGRLQAVVASSAVSFNDIPSLLTALIILANHAFVLRPRPQFLTLATLLLSEWLREAHEGEKRGMNPLAPSLFDQARENGLSMVVDYSKTWLRPLAAAVHALVPQDLYDNMERNVEAPSMGEVAAFEIPEDLEDKRWSDGSVPVIEIIRKVLLHASSLDRKASKRAILNATPQCRASTTALRTFMSRDAEGEAKEPRSIVENRASQKPSRCEHYFSFLRLYDTYEKEGRSLAEFAAQLVFLALQLNPDYISRHTRGSLDVSSKEECSQIAKLIMEKEHAPTTAEVIASPIRGNEETDSFILRLMEMYAERDKERGKNGTLNGAPALNPNLRRRPIQCSNPVYGTISLKK